MAESFSVMDYYPYEGDLSAVFEAVTLPRLVDECAEFTNACIKLVWEQISAVFPWLPALVDVDEILAPLDR